MDLQRRISAFARLGDELRQLPADSFAALSEAVQSENPWFTPEHVALSLRGITRFIQKDTLTKWVSRYDFNHSAQKIIGVVMAGNIPLAGFHDFLSVLISGHTIKAKLSLKDSALIRFIAEKLITIEPGFQGRIALTTEQLHGIDAVIATGSDNSARYFEYYFRKYPSIIRKNRTSAAIIRREENPEALAELGKDVFSYFGLGCRNVSKLFLPESFDFHGLFKKWETCREIIHHHKYANNYDYQKSIALVNRTPFYDNGFVLLFENDQPVSPIATVYFQYYCDEPHLNELLHRQNEKIQCIVGSSAPATVPFGKAQLPDVWDYADNADTLDFLCRI